MIKFCAINQSFLVEKKNNDKKNQDQNISSENSFAVEVLSKEKEEFRIKNLYKQALELQMKSKYNDLLDSLEEILQSSIMKESLEISSHMEAVKAATYKLLANTHRKLNNCKESYVFYRMAIKMNTQDLNLWYGFAVTCERMGDWDESVKAYEQVLTINNVHWPSLESLIVITFALVDFEKSAQYCQQALFIDGKYEVAIYILQKIFAYQPNLKTIVKEFIIEILNDLSNIVNECVSKKLAEKIEKIKTDITKKRIESEKSEMIGTIAFKVPMKKLNWDFVSRSIVTMFMGLKDANKLESIIDMRSILPDQQMNPISDSSATVFMDDNVWFSDSLSSDMEIVEGCDGAETMSENMCPEEATCNFRITRNSAQMAESPEEINTAETKHYFARLIRMNILNEVHTMANERFNVYNDLVSKKRESSQLYSTTEDIRYRAKSLNHEDVLNFIQLFDGRKVTIIEVALDFLRYIIKKEYFIWHCELVDDYLTLSNLIRTHVSSQNEESATETLISIKRFLLEVECLLDRKQSELEGKLHKSEREFKLSDFVPQKYVDEFSNRILSLEIKHSKEFEKELTIMQIRVLWLSFILADMFKNEVEVRFQLDCLRRCLLDNNIPVHIRPNCTHYSVITLKKVEDNLSASFKFLKIDLLQEMYKKEQYEDIINKTNTIIGVVILPKEDYAEDMNSYMIQISFNCSSYHQILISLLKQPLEKIIDDNYLRRIYSDTTAVLEEITNIVDILNDPKQKNRSPLTNKQMSFLTENYFKVAQMLFTNATNFLKLLELKGLKLIEVVGVGEVARFVVLAKEYFYHAFVNKVSEINVAHIWCMYSHFKSLELHDPLRYNQSVTYNPNDELDLPPSLNFLSLIHDYFGSIAKCEQCDGAILKLIITAVSEYIEEIRPKFRKLGVFLANHSDVLSLLDQALYCIRPVQRPAIDKSRKPIDHGCKKNVTINIALVDLLLSYLAPERIPEVDSVKNLSITADLNNHFLEIISYLPDSIFSESCSEETIKKAIESEEPLDFPVIPRSKYSQLFYCVADHYFKNNEFEKALEYYIKNLRFKPFCFDSWAGIALIYYKRLEDKFNMMDNNSESLSNEEVMCCLNSFNHAISLDSENLTILIEKGCFCYEVHSYASRILKKAQTREIDESFIKGCEMWSKIMLENAKECYEMALETEKFREEKEEKWLYYYMLSKCLEKSEENTLLEVLENMEKSMDALDSSGAKYVRKVVIYTKIPYRAVEAVEVYYKYHATILKCLLRNQSKLLSTAQSYNTNRIAMTNQPKDIDHNILLEIQQKLINMNHSSFIVNVGKIGNRNIKNGSRKRNLLKSDDCPEPTKVARLSHSVDPITDVIDMSNIPPELRYDDVEDECIIQEVVLPSQAEDTKSVYERCIDLCRTAMEVVLQRLPLHYKALYHLAYIHSYVPHLKNIEKSYDYLMGSSKSGKSTINGLFKDRKTSNFFSGIWRIPVADIDRNGSFAHHMYRSMNLLMTVLRQMNAWKELSSINSILRKSGTDKRGFLSNTDRQMLVRKSMGHALYSVKEWLVKHQGDVSKDDLLLIHSLYCVAVKQSQGIEKMRSVLQEAFYKCGVTMDLYVNMFLNGGDSNEEKRFELQKMEHLSINTIDKVMVYVREQKK